MGIVSMGIIEQGAGYIDNHGEGTTPSYTKEQLQNMVDTLEQSDKVIDEDSELEFVEV